jgi:DNA primase
MSVTDEIKARLDIVSYINQYVPLKKAGKYHKACCPFHGEKTPSFVVNDDRQSWRCFGACAEGGDIFNFAMKYHGWDFKEALVELGKQAGVEVEQRTPEQKQRAERGDYLRGMLNEVAHAYHTKLYDPDDPAAVDALRYAREGRGLSDETIKAFGIGYAPAGWQNVLDHLIELGYSQDDVIEAGLALRNDRGKVYDRFRNRFMVPIRDQRGRVVGFGGRVLDPEDSPKYMNSPQTPVFDKSRLLFGLDLAKQSIRESETAVIVEGYMDAITAHQAGFTNVVAQMGTAMTETQLRLIAPKHAKTVVLALDSDAAGQNATRRSLEVAREALASDFTGKLSIDMRVLQIPDAKDPDDLIREDPDRWRELVAHATPVVDFVIDMELAGLSDEPTVQQRESVARSLMPILTATENNLYTSDESVQKLALRLLLPERELMRIARRSP